jgi:hypothetical protein
MRTNSIFDKHLKFFFIFSLVFITISCGSSTRTIAVEEGWELLGESKANFVRETDVINVNSRSQFTDLRFKVEKRDIKLTELKITFESGDKLEPAIDEIIPAGRESKLIELAKDGRTITRIEFRYRTTGSIVKGQAKILVFGKRYHSGY